MTIHSTDGKNKCDIVGLSIRYRDRAPATEYVITAIDDKEKVRYSLLQRLSSSKGYFFYIGRFTYTLTKPQLLALLWARMEGDFNIQDRYR